MVHSIQNVDRPEAGEKLDRASRRTDELLDALEELIISEGFARLTVADIAARLRCSRRTIYELAPSKNELVLLVLNRFFKRIRDDAEVMTRDIDDPGRKMYEYLQVGVRAAHRMSPMTVSDIDKWVPSRKIWQAHIRMRVEGLRRLVEEGIERGVFRGVHAHLVAETVFAAISRIREPDFYHHANITVAEAFREFYGIVLAALLQADHKS